MYSCLIYFWNFLLEMWVIIYNDDKITLDNLICKTVMFLPLITWSIKMFLPLFLCCPHLRTAALKLETWFRTLFVFLLSFGRTFSLLLSIAQLLIYEGLRAGRSEMPNPEDPNFLKICLPRVYFTKWTL